MSETRNRCSLNRAGCRVDSEASDQWMTVPNRDQRTRDSHDLERANEGSYE
jgi:hypothetical protein